MLFQASAAQVTDTNQSLVDCVYQYREIPKPFFGSSFCANLALAAALLASSTNNAAAYQSSEATPAIDVMALKCRSKLSSGCRPATRAVKNMPPPPLVLDPEPEPTQTLAEALDEAYHSAPALKAQRYRLRVSDEDYAQTLTELRTTASVQVAGEYKQTVNGRITLAEQFDLSSSAISRTMSVTAQANQPLYMGGKATADREQALASVDAGRAQLRGAEGDLLLQVITAYSDIRRDNEVLRLRAANLKQLQGMLAEVNARREAGELTRTDIGLAETQLQLAILQKNTAEQQIEQDRSRFVMLVGREPGHLAPMPNLPCLPGTISDALDIAQSNNPDLAEAEATEQASRASITSMKAQGMPSVNLVGSATLSGLAVPYYLKNQDQIYAARLVLTIPLANGGRVGSLVAQAQDRNAVDRLEIDVARRQMIFDILNAWSAANIAQRNILVGGQQVASARVYNEGTFEEYRAGLRSTFDVLYAQVALRDAEIALVGAHRDMYVAQATLLRRIGVLEARNLLDSPGLYDPDVHLRAVARRGALLLEALPRALDNLGYSPGYWVAPINLPASSPKPTMIKAEDPAQGGAFRGAARTDNVQVNKLISNRNVPRP